MKVDQGQIPIGANLSGLASNRKLENGSGIAEEATMIKL
jgi:hypothetical protein